MAVLEVAVLELLAPEEQAAVQTVQIVLRHHQRHLQIWVVEAAGVDLHLQVVMALAAQAVQASLSSNTQYLYLP